MKLNVQIQLCALRRRPLHAAGQKVNPSSFKMQETSRYFDSTGEIEKENNSVMRLASLHHFRFIVF